MCFKYILNYDKTVNNCPPLLMAALEQTVNHVNHFYPNGCLEWFETHHIIVLPSCHNNNSWKFNPDIQQAKYVMGPNVLNEWIACQAVQPPFHWLYQAPMKLQQTSCLPSGLLLCTLLNICSNICHITVTSQSLFGALLTHLLWGTRSFFSRVQRQDIKSKPRRWYYNIADEEAVIKVESPLFPFVEKPTVHWTHASGKKTCR